MNEIVMHKEVVFMMLESILETYESNRSEISKKQAQILLKKEPEFYTEESAYKDILDELDDFIGRSFTVQLSDKIEYLFRQLCNEIQEKNKFILSYSDLNGKPIEKALKYCMQLNIRFTKAEFQEIELLDKLRNCIVHADGNILESKDTIILNKISKDRKLHFNGFENTLYISIDNCRRILISCKQEVDAIFSKLGYSEF